MLLCCYAVMLLRDIGHLHLIEPLSACTATLNSRFGKDCRVNVHRCAVRAKEGELTMNVPRQLPIRESSYPQFGCTVKLRRRCLSDRDKHGSPVDAWAGRGAHSLQTLDVQSLLVSYAFVRATREWTSYRGDGCLSTGSSVPRSTGRGLLRRLK